jgi:hypothetical protein
MKQERPNSLMVWRKGLLGIGAIMMLVSSQALIADAQDRRQAKRIHDRLAGTPPSPAVLNDMEQTILSGGGAYQAALDVIEGPGIYQSSAKNFYNVTVKNMTTPWTNEAQTVFAPLNDYTATVIGMIRDDIDFRRVLWDDIIYVGASNLGLPTYSPDNNDHYEYMERLDIDLSDSDNLVRDSQTPWTGLPASAAAGVLTTRAAARAFFIDGTNRAMFRFTMMNHLCTDLEPIKDTSRSPDRVQQDVSRSPGGDSRLFMNNCVGCHAGMDPLNQAFAYYNYEYPDGDEDGGRLVYTPGSVQGKFLINANNFKYGYITQDDSWENYWRVGPNSLLGWSSSLPGAGNGASSMGRELANTEAFASCQVKKVFKTVCFREPSLSELSTVTGQFVSSGYSMKEVFARTAVACMGI